MDSREFQAEIIPGFVNDVLGVQTLSSSELIKADGLDECSPFEYAKLSKVIGPPMEEDPSGVEGQSSSGAVNDGNENVVSSSSLPQSLKFWVAGNGTSTASKDFRSQEASYSLVGALSLYRSFQLKTQEQSTGGSNSSENKKNNDENSSVNYLSFFAAFFCAGKALQNTSNASTKAFRGSHSKKGNFQYRRDSFLEDDWESRKTRLINVESLAARIRDVSFEESLTESSPKRASPLDRICSTLFSTGSAEFCTRISLPLNRTVQSKNNVFAKTSTGSDFELSDAAFSTAAEFNGVWKAQSGGEMVQQALAAMAMKKRTRGTRRGGVQYLLIDSTRSHFRTSEWKNATQHIEQRPWDGSRISAVKSNRKRGRKLSVKLNGSSIESTTQWIGGIRTRLIQEYSLSPDLRRLKIVFTMERGDDLGLQGVSLPGIASRTCMVHTMYFKRQSEDVWSTLLRSFGV